MAQENPKEYWDKNIDNWGKFYLESSHSEEEFNSPGWLIKLYRRFIVPVEARLMGERYRLTIDFINRYVKPGMLVADIGCGTGIFTVEMLKRGAKVVAIDISTSSLEATRRNVEKNAPEHVDAVTFMQLNVSESQIPAVDVAVAMGVTPYVAEIEPFYRNILASTKIFYCLILDPKHWANRVRRVFSFLNVRNVHWFECRQIDSIITSNQCTLIERRNFASGYLDIVKSNK